jgi:diguanylate cyclase (GGDEF)-like protein
MLGTGGYPARRTTFSTRFALILLALGVLIAAATAAIPLSQSNTETRNSALVRAADKAGIAVNLLRSQQQSLSAYVAGLAPQLSAVSASGPDLDTVLRGSSVLIAPGDVLGVTTAAAPRAFKGGTPLDVTKAPWNDLIGAVVGRRTVVTTATQSPFLVEQAPLPQTPGTAVFIARPLTAAVVSQLANTIASSADASDVVVVNQNAFAVGGRLAGHLVAVGSRVPGGLATLLSPGHSPEIVDVDGRTLAAAARPFTGGLTLLVTSQVPPVTDLLTTVAAPVGLTAVAMILLALVLVFIIVDRYLARPLRRLDRAVEALAREDFDVPIPAGRDDEIGRLGQTFDRMRRELRGTIRAAEARAEITAELNAAQPLPAALTAVCGRLRAGTGAERSVIVVASSSIADAFAASEGLSRRPDAGTLLRGDGPVAEAMRLDGTGPVLAGALDGTDEARLGMRTICAAPMRIGQRILGVVAVADKEDGFGTIDADLVLTTAEQVSLALERAHVLALAQRQAITDEMTGLYNYRFLVDYLDQQIALAERLKAPLAVLMLDIDRFKSLNDEYGHHAGDQALKLFAKTMAGTVRRSDLAARYGGEEFCIVMANTPREEAKKVAEKIRAAVAAIQLPVPPHPRPISFTVSIGGVAFPDDTGSASQLLQRADAALYRAKRAGRDRVCFANDEPVRPQRPRRALAGRGVDREEDDEQPERRRSSQ